MARACAGYAESAEWDCFRFMLIQYADHFTFCVCVDHLHMDATFIGVLFVEIHMMYAALVGGRAPIRLAEAGSYYDYCVRHHQYTSGLTLNSPEVRAWIEFFENNDGTLPDCPVPLGDGSGSCDLMSAQLMDERQTAGFESACIASGARFSGGVLACAALAEYELTGAETYYGIIATDTRSTPTGLHDNGLVHRLCSDHRPCRRSIFRLIPSVPRKRPLIRVKTLRTCRSAACWNWRHG